MDWGALIAVLAAISGIGLGWLGRARTVRTDTQKDTERKTQMRVDLEYIKRGIDDIRAEMRMLNARLDDLDKRVTRLEETAKNNTYRLNAIDKKKTGGIS